MFDNMDKFLYVIPFAIAVLLIASYLVSIIKTNMVVILKYSNEGGKKVSFVLQKLFKLIPRDSKLRKFYANYILKYSNLKFERLVEIKAYLFIIAMAFFLTMYFTNIKFFSSSVFNSFKYKVDFAYEYHGVENETEALKQEQKYLNQAIKEIGKNVSVQSAEDAQQLIRSMVTERKYDLQEPIETLANKVYYRLKDYYGVRRLNLLPYAFLALIISFIPELILAIRNKIIVSSTRKELVFLKKLIILNGSIPPVDFFEVLELLINKSRYYKPILEDIRDKNLANSIDNKKIYSNLIEDTNNLDEKLFFEKLDEANNYNFEQAIRNITHEFELDKREMDRHLQKQVSKIQINGFIGFSIIILLMFVIIVIVWVNTYDMSDLGF